MPAATAKCELAEVLVERHDNATFSLCTQQHVRVRAAGSVLPNPRDVVSLLAKRGDNYARNILVGEKPGRHVLP